jgi:hypothetical protein
VLTAISRAGRGGAGRQGQVEVVQVQPSSQGARAGLVPGLILMAVGGTDVSGMAYDKAIEVIKQHQQRPLTLRFNYPPDAGRTVAGGQPQPEPEPEPQASEADTGRKGRRRGKGKDKKSQKAGRDEAGSQGGGSGGDDDAALEGGGGGGGGDISRLLAAAGADLAAETVQARPRAKEVKVMFGEEGGLGLSFKQTPAGEATLLSLFTPPPPARPPSQHAEVGPRASSGGTTSYPLPPPPPPPRRHMAVTCGWDSLSQGVIVGVIVGVRCGGAGAGGRLPGRAHRTAKCQGQAPVQGQPAERAGVCGRWPTPSPILCAAGAAVTAARWPAA